MICINGYSPRLSELLFSARQSSEDGEKRRQIAQYIFDNVELRAELHAFAMGIARTAQEPETSAAIISDLQNWFMPETEHCFQTLYCSIGARRQVAVARHDLVWLMQQAQNMARTKNSLKRKFSHLNSNRLRDLEQSVWLWFTENLYRYDPNIASQTAWFGNRMYHQARQKNDSITTENARVERPRIVDGKEYDPVEQFEDEKEILEWIACAERLESVRDILAERQAYLKRICIGKYPQINCFSILSKVLPQADYVSASLVPGYSWEQIVKDTNVERTVILRFYRERCKPKLKEIIRGLDSKDG